MYIYASSPRGYNVRSASSSLRFFFFFIIAKLHVRVSIWIDSFCVIIFSFFPSAVRFCVCIHMFFFHVVIFFYCVIFDLRCTCRETCYFFLRLPHIDTGFLIRRSCGRFEKSFKVKSRKRV